MPKRESKYIVWYKQYFQKIKFLEIMWLLLALYCMLYVIYEAGSTNLKILGGVMF